MGPVRATTVAVLTARIAYGASLIAAPQRLTRRWLGPASQDAGTQVSLRALGAREVVLHCGALVAMRSGSPVRPWLIGSILGDLTDIGATIVARHELPDGSPIATMLVGGTSATITGLLAAIAPE
jgi:hypothetical protein